MGRAAAAVGAFLAVGAVLLVPLQARGVNTGIVKCPVLGANAFSASVSARPTAMPPPGYTPPTFTFTGNYAALGAATSAHLDDGSFACTYATVGTTVTGSSPGMLCSSPGGQFTCQNPCVAAKTCQTPSQAMPVYLSCPVGMGIDATDVPGWRIFYDDGQGRGAPAQQSAQPQCVYPSIWTTAYAPITSRMVDCAPVDASSFRCTFL
jgi:hypothetical protein